MQHPQTTKTVYVLLDPPDSDSWMEGGRERERGIKDDIVHYIVMYAYTMNTIGAKPSAQ
jgi:hypothetical protein